MVTAMPAALAAAEDVLSDFDQSTGKLVTAGSHFAPYLLSGSQVGAVALLLWKAKKLAEENCELQQMLNESQSLIDMSISYLDRNET